MDEHRIEGVTADVNAAMQAVRANVLAEDGLLFRTCEHGVRHPVAHLNPHAQFTSDAIQQRHARRSPHGDAVTVECDGCCQQSPWP